MPSTAGVTFRGDTRGRLGARPETIANVNHLLETAGQRNSGTATESVYTTKQQQV